MKHQTVIQTRYPETAQDGIIHHSSYVVYMEIARLELLQKMGLDINAIEEQGMFCPVTKLSCSYLKPLHSLEEISIEVTIASHTKVRFELSYEIFKGEECVFRGTSLNCFLNASMKPIPIPQDFLKRLQENI